MPIFFKKLLILFLMVVYAFPSVSQSGNSNLSHKEEEQHEGEKFNAGKYIIEHVIDAYDWHIASFGGKHITVPLPVILYSKNPELHNGQKFHIFMSTKFNHAHDSYRGFKISHSKKNNGKIVELDRNGNETGRPFDFSLTKTIAGALVAAFILIVFLLFAAQKSKRNAGRAPSGIQNLVEPIIIFIRDQIAIPSIGEDKYKKFMPPLLTLFFFILLNNLLGLVPVFPFGANVTGNIAVTMVFALFTFFVTNIRGNKHYWKEIFNPDVPVLLKFPIPLMPFLEMLGMLTKPFVLMVRLFANMLAGHLIVAVFISLIFIFGSIMGPAAGYGVSPVAVAFSVFIMLLDVLVSFIQAYVFTLLSAIYFGMASAENH
jgi:F-type H+-transporting ATPase subunit a